MQPTLHTISLITVSFLIAVTSDCSYATNVPVTSQQSAASSSIVQARKNMRALCEQQKANAARAQVPYQTCIRSKGNAIGAKAQCASQQPIQPIVCN